MRSVAAEPAGRAARKIALVNPPWSFDGSIYFGCHEPHLPLEFGYARALLAASNESYAANLDTYKQGLSTIVELLTAGRDLANARYTIVQSRADLLTSSAAVAYAVGAVEMPIRP